MTWPGTRELLFSLKAFAAAMLAFWIACALNLPRPTWSIFTVYTLMQPVSGAVRSKAAYRMIGTVAGAAIALLLMGLLANLPGALFLTLGLVTLVGVFVSMLDRMPRGYAFMMAGITAAVIGLPDTLDPLSAFATAMARTEEVLLGIVCATAIDSVFFPHPAGVVLNARVAAWLAEARDATARALSGVDGPRDGDAKLARLATEAAELDGLAAHVGYDSVPNRPSARVVRLLHTRMLLLIRLMFVAGDWTSALRPGLAEHPLIERALVETRAWVEAMPAASPADDAAVLAAIDALRAERDVSADAVAVLRGGIGVMLRDLLTGWQDCNALQRAVTDGAVLPERLVRAARREPLSIPYRDPLRALLVLLPVALAFLLVVGYWTVTGWEQGPAAALMTLVAGLFASSAAEPSAQVTRVLAILTVAASVAIVYQFGVLPAVQNFPVLVVALGLFLVPAGAFIPITQGTGLLLIVLTALMLSLQPEYEATFASVADGALGALVGLAATALLARITLAPGTAWTTRHLLHVGWSDLAAIAGGDWRPDHAAYALRALDRYTVLAPQLDRPAGAPELTTEALLGELRIGLNILRLRDTVPDLPTAARAAVEALLDTLSHHFAARRRSVPPALSGLRERGMAAMAEAAAAMPAPGAQTAWLMLAGVQRSLFGTTEWLGGAEAADAR